MIKAKTHYTASSVITLKLVTGEEIIGYYHNREGDQIALRKPVTLVAQGQGIGFAPFLMTSDYMETNEPLVFSAASVVIETETEKTFADAYIKQVSGVDLSQDTSSKLII